MQKSSMAEKKKVYWDGVEIPGLVSVAELTLEKSTIDVPSFKRIRKIQSGIITIPVVEMKYRIDRDTATQSFWEDFYFNDVVKDGIVYRVDAFGVEFAKRVLQQTECYKYTEPAYNAESPEYASITVGLIPWEILFL
jgi:hypothetical protein